MVGFIVMLCALVTFPRHPEVGVSALEGMEYRSIAGRLLEAAESGSLVFVNKERDRKLIHGLASLDSESVPALTLPLARALESLANISTPQKPLKVTSIFRPLAAGRPNEPHGSGQAVDIAAFGGYEIRSANPSDCEQVVLAVIAALGAGYYRLGLPMPPHSEPIPLLPTPDRRPDWPFFPPPLAQIHDELDIVLPRLAIDGRNPPSRLSPVILCWANARYAPLEDLQSVRVKEGIQSAILRGVIVHSLFPDGTNHLHLDTKPTP